MAEDACGNKEKNSARVDYPGDVGENESSTSRDPDFSGSSIFVFNRGPVAQLGARPGLAGKIVGSSGFLKWACGAAGSALPWHGRGRRFDPDQVHQFPPVTSVYILQNQSSQKFYIGCAADPVSRLAEHQRGQTTSTRGRGPWAMVYQERFGTLTEARSRERHLKSWKSHRSIQELIETGPQA
jgi:putative endonuclease